MKEIKDMTDTELQNLISEINSELKKRNEKRQNEARKKIVELAESNQINLAELASHTRIYRNPADQWQTWNGKGRKPKWIKEWLDRGGTLDELEVK
ncbi:TPA: H-NS histone family protein [Vibrio parahaemolyticus]|uniref:H-NS histone family protein n=1 Tax=Vibrio parahaemolyticus TaxID=670 RepID=UPI0028095381|nr:H-NS histone family protein [Vibrio parahaemolyticus]ELA9292976.1 H-NS histone family protein [Vibrio parahaemolyticus]MDS1925672.1 H-NS histone family protein [Vibrio parahaemolyticus]HCG8016779.1 H-NS histone family protein [Vibrio parahaemolyticus]